MGWVCAGSRSPTSDVVVRADIAADGTGVCPTVQTRGVSCVEWPDPPAGDAGAPKALETWTTEGAKHPWPLLGTIALAAVLAGPTLMVLGLMATIALGALFPLPLFLAAAITLLLVPFGLVVAVVAAARNRGRWRGVAAIIAAVPALALALDLSRPLLEYVAG